MGSGIFGKALCIAVGKRRLQLCLPLQQGICLRLVQTAVLLAELNRGQHLFMPQLIKPAKLRSVGCIQAGLLRPGAFVGPGNIQHRFHQRHNSLHRVVPLAARLRGKGLHAVLLLRVPVLRIGMLKVFQGLFQLFRLQPACPPPGKFLLPCRFSRAVVHRLIVSVHIRKSIPPGINAQADSRRQQCQQAQGRCASAPAFFPFLPEQGHHCASVSPEK